MGKRVCGPAIATPRVALQQPEVATGRCGVAPESKEGRRLDGKLNFAGPQVFVCLTRAVSVCSCV